jgi:hypothetical protein
METIDTLMGNSPRPTSAQIRAALAMTIAVSETIRELGEVPAGTLYATLMSRVDLAGFEAMIRNLKNAGLVAEKASLLTWVGPKF